MRPIVVSVDDDRRVLDSLAMLMESAGYTPQSFTSGEEFLQSPALTASACVIADLQSMLGRELRRRYSADRAVRSCFVVIASPLPDDGSSMRKVVEVVIVQALVAKLAVERLDVAVLHGPARLNELECDGVSVSPLIERLGSEFRPLVGANRRRPAAKARNTLEHANDVVASHAMIERDLERLLGEVIDHRARRIEIPVCSFIAATTVRFACGSSANEMVRPAPGPGQTAIPFKRRTTMRNQPRGATSYGIDIGKNIFHVAGFDQSGKPVQRAKFSRATIFRFFANAPTALIGLEACPGAQWLARKLQKAQRLRQLRDWRARELAQYGMTLHGVRENGAFRWL